ncbi:MAG: GtrA family protein [Sulfitobacter sp.]
MKGTDLNTLLRFAVVGVSVAAIYIVLYLLLVTLGVYQPLANLVAFAVAIAVQYVGQTAWTFGRALGLPDQMFRFACTITLGLIVSSLLTGFVGPTLGWTDWMSALIVTIVLPIQNYLIFRNWVFSAPHEPSET